MSKKRIPGRVDGKRRSLTLHATAGQLGTLDRCRVLLSESTGNGLLPSRGEVVRIAVRALLLSLLGQRANLSDPADPITQEYLSTMDVQQRKERENGL